MIRSPVLLLFSSLLCLGEIEPIQKIAFGSCHKESRKAESLKTIAEWEPDVFVWMGDNIYGDTKDMSVLRAKYEHLAKKPDYRRISESATILGIWDDHDYGANDAGKEFAFKAESQQEFLDFLKVDKESPRRKRQGVYHYEDLGPKGQQVRLILLDTRYHRDEIGSDGTILGKEQWAWLEKSLQESEAEVNIIVSSIQVLPSDHRFEKWSNFPSEKERLFKLLAKEEVPPVLILSGDRHLAEISLEPSRLGYPLYEITSSALNNSFGRNRNEKNSLRVGENYVQNNFGILTFNWKGDFPEIEAAVFDEKGEIQLKVSVLLKRSHPKTR